MLGVGPTWKVVVTILGAYAAQFDIRVPKYRIDVGYTALPAKSVKARLPTYAIALRYSTTRPAFHSRMPALALELRYDERVLGPVLARLGLKRNMSVASAIPEPVVEPPAKKEAVAPPAPSPAPSPKVRVESGSLTLDVAKISPDGVSVFAGRADAGSEVSLFENGQPIGSVVAGPDGEWSLSTEHKFSATEAGIELRGGKAQRNVAEAASSAHALEPSGATSEQYSAPQDRNEEPKPEPGSPAAELFKKFEETVEAAREDARQVQSSAPPPEAVTPSRDVPADVIAETAAHEPVDPAPAPEQVPVETIPQVQPPEAADGTGAESTKRLQTDTPAMVADVAPPAQAHPATPAEPVVIPIPMQFVYREASLTDNGRQAVSLLLEYLKLKRLESVTLTGHADERGSDDYNLNLSRERLNTIEKMLREGGYMGKLELLAKGESEPYTGIDRKRIPREELMQLDRRVELRVNR